MNHWMTDFLNHAFWQGKGGDGSEEDDDDQEDDDEDDDDDEGDEDDWILSMLAVHFF